MGQAQNEQSKERWPRIDAGQALKPNLLRTSTTSSLPMNDLFRESGPPSGSAAGPPHGDAPTMSEPAAQPAPASTSPAAGNTAGARSPRVDLGLQERPAVRLPGWCALLVAAFCVAAVGCLLWLTGRLPMVLDDVVGDPPAQAALPWGPVAIGSLALCGAVALICVVGLTRVRNGTAVVLHSRGRYRATLRRTGLVWRSPLLQRRTIDTRIRHWHSRIDAVTDRDGTPLNVGLLVVWQIHHTARALYAVDDHEAYLKEQIEAAATQVVSTLPCDSFREQEPSLRDGRRLAGELTQALAADVRAIGIEIYAVKIVKVEYTAHVAEAMRQRQLAALEAKHREDTLEEVVQAVEATMHKLTAHGGVEWDDYERKAFVRELTVAFYAARTSAVLPANALAQPQ
ncbi:SPFH domain-containing protein [Streptomyces noursei]